MFLGIYFSKEEKTIVCPAFKEGLAKMGKGKVPFRLVGMVAGALLLAGVMFYKEEIFTDHKELGETHEDRVVCLHPPCEGLPHQEHLESENGAHDGGHGDDDEDEGEPAAGGDMSGGDHVKVADPEDGQLAHESGQRVAEGVDQEGNRDNQADLEVQDTWNAEDTADSKDENSEELRASSSTSEESALVVNTGGDAVESNQWEGGNGMEAANSESTAGTLDADDLKVSAETEERRDEEDTGTSEEVGGTEVVDEEVVPDEEETSKAQEQIVEERVVPAAENNSGINDLTEQDEPIVEQPALPQDQGMLELASGDSAEPEVGQAEPESVADTENSESAAADERMETADGPPEVVSTSSGPETQSGTLEPANPTTVAREEPVIEEPVYREPTEREIEAARMEAMFQADLANVHAGHIMPNHIYPKIASIRKEPEAAMVQQAEVAPSVVEKPAPTAAAKPAAKSRETVKPEEKKKDEKKKDDKKEDKKREDRKEERQERRDRREKRKEKNRRLLSI